MLRRLLRFVTVDLAALRDEIVAEADRPAGPTTEFGRCATGSFGIRSGR